MAVRSTQGQNRAVRKGEGVSPSVLCRWMTKTAMVEVRKGHTVYTVFYSSSTLPYRIFYCFILVYIFSKKHDALYDTD